MSICLLVFVIACASFFDTPSVFGQETSETIWRFGGRTTNYGDQSNWSNGVPAAQDSVLYEQNSNAITTIISNRSIQKLTIEAPEAVLSLLGPTPSLTIAEDIRIGVNELTDDFFSAALTVAGGSLTADSVSLGSSGFTFSNSLEGASSGRLILTQNAVLNVNRLRADRTFDFTSVTLLPGSVLNGQNVSSRLNATDATINVSDTLILGGGSLINSIVTTNGFSGGLNMEGGTLSVTGTFPIAGTLTNASVSASSVISPNVTVLNGGTFTVDNAFRLSSRSADEFGRVIDEGTLAINSGVFSAESVRVPHGSSSDFNFSFPGRRGKFEINGGAVVTTNSFAYDRDGLVLNNGTLNVIGGEFIRQFSDNSLQIDGENSGDHSIVNLLNGATASFGQVVVANDHQGSVTVTGAGSRWDSSEIFFVARGGNGSLTIADGGTVNSARGNIGRGTSSVGFTQVTGAASTWRVTATGTDQNVNGNLLVGEFGNGTLEISNGGSVSNNTAAIATQASSIGVVDVSGSDSLWTNADSIFVGGGSTVAGGAGTINIDGGEVSAAGTLKLWNDGRVNLAEGILDVVTLDVASTDTADAFNMTGGRLVVDTIVGDFEQNGGILTSGDSAGLTSISGDYELISGEIKFEIAGTEREIQYDSLDLLAEGTSAGLATLNGTIDVNFSDGFSGSVGDVFLIVDAAGGIDGTPEFDFTNAELEAGLVWDTSTFFSTGSISVVDSSPTVLLGDVDQDGTVNFLDITLFISLLSTGTFQEEADANQDGEVNFLDISQFISLLSSQ